MSSGGPDFDHWAPGHRGPSMLEMKEMAHFLLFCGCIVFLSVCETRSAHLIHLR